MGGLIKHVATTERGWIDIVLGIVSGSQEDYETNFRLAEDETLASVLSLYDEVAARTEAEIAKIPDLGRAVPVPDSPWYPDDVDAWSVRWVLLHLIEETATEGWPATEWLQPWEPPDA